MGRPNPVSAKSELNIEFINVLFPTPVFPIKSILFFLWIFVCFKLFNISE